MFRSAVAPLLQSCTSAARTHVLGLALLAVILQAAAPVVHARLMAWHASPDGQRLDLTVRCLAGAARQGTGDTGEPVLPVATGDCLLCAGGLTATGALPSTQPVIPKAPAANPRFVSARSWIRVELPATAHRSRAPPRA